MLKKFSQFVIILTVFCFCALISGNEPATTYFSFPQGSNWVYVDQDGNEVIREAAEDKVIPAEIFHAFSYEPAVTDWFDYIPYFQPNKFKVDDDGITFYSSDEFEKLHKARLTKEIETVLRIEPPNGETVTYTVTADVPEQTLFIPFPLTLNEEWDTVKLNAALNISVNDPSSPNNNNRMVFNYKIFETGTVVNKETIETPAGTFNDCLKIEFRTETDLNLPALHGGENPPGETVTTLWLAPNVGIVKCHREMEDMLLKAAPLNEFPFTTTINTLELKKYKIKPTDIEANTNYFPVSLGSYWVYEDQDGNELTRRAIEDKVIPEKRLKAYNYKPEKVDWEVYDVYADSKLYDETDDGIVLHVGDAAAKAVQARLNKEFDIIEKISKRMHNERNDNNIDITHELDVKATEIFDFLPKEYTSNKEWEVAKIKANINVKYIITNLDNKPNSQRIFSQLYMMTINEKGKLIGTESVDTPVGRFENCIKVEFQSEVTIDASDEWQAEHLGKPGETVTTIWFAPQVGIVKFHKKSENIFLKALFKSSENEAGITEEDLATFNAFDVKTLELKRYEIITDNLE